MSNKSELNMELYADYVAMRADRDSLREALIGLVKVNEEHNQSMIAIIGRPAMWDDSYLDQARKAIAAPAEDVRAVVEKCSEVPPQCSEQLRTLFEQAYAEDHNCTLDWCQQQRLSNGSYNDRYMARAWHWWQRGKEST